MAATLRMNCADEEPTRELDPLSRTQETPTIETPMIDRSSQTMREKTDKALFAKAQSEQTAELSLDDLGLDVDSLEHTGSLEDTTSLEKDTGDTNESSRPLRDDEMTQLAPSLGSFDRTMEAPRAENFDIETTGTIYIDQVDLSGGDTVEQARPDVDSTASMRRPAKVDVDLDDLSGGNQQKVVVGRWLRTDPRLAVLDEPFRGVDIGARRRIGDAARARAAAGAAVVVLSSDVDEVLDVADRVVVLVSGRIVLDTPAGALDRARIVAALLDDPGHRKEIA